MAFGPVLSESIPEEGWDFMDAPTGLPDYAEQAVAMRSLLSS